MRKTWTLLFLLSLILFGCHRAKPATPTKEPAVSVAPTKPAKALTKGPVSTKTATAAATATAPSTPSPTPLPSIPIWEEGRHIRIGLGQNVVAFAEGFQPFEVVRVQVLKEDGTVMRDVQGKVDAVGNLFIALRIRSEGQLPFGPGQYSLKVKGSRDAIFTFEVTEEVHPLFQGKGCGVYPGQDAYVKGQEVLLYCFTEPEGTVILRALGREKGFQADPVGFFGVVTPVVSPIEVQLAIGDEIFTFDLNVEVGHEG